MKALVGSVARPHVGLVVCVEHDEPLVGTLADQPADQLADQAQVGQPVAQQAQREGTPTRPAEELRVLLVQAGVVGLALPDLGPRTVQRGDSERR